MKQDFKTYTPDDFSIWKILFDRQESNLQKLASRSYLDLLQSMSPVLHAGRIPEFSKIDHWFSTKTGWEIQCVPGLIPVADFFELLAKKRFCSSTWLRSMKNLDYLEEPDMFHDIFGHVPLLADPVFSDFMEAFGKLGVAAKDNKERVTMLQRLYWFTIEFGLVRDRGVKIYGAGIASSFGESNLALGEAVDHVNFDLDLIMQTPFETDHLQQRYFVIDDFEQLFQAVAWLHKRWLE